MVRADSRKPEAPGERWRPSTAVAACALAAPVPGAAAHLGRRNRRPARLRRHAVLRDADRSRALQCARRVARRHPGLADRLGQRSRRTGMLRIRGRHLDSVGKVLFVGAAGQADNIGVVPSARTLEHRRRQGPAARQQRQARPPRPRRPQLASPAPTTPSRHARHPTAASPPRALKWPVRGIDHRGVRRDGAATTATPAWTSPPRPGLRSRRPPRARSSCSAGRAATGTSPASRHATLVTCYAHQSSYADGLWAPSCARARSIGRVGCTGNCSGPHLHFEVRKGPDAWSTPMDPVGFLPRR